MNAGQIWKFPLTGSSPIAVQMPKDAEILSAQFQRGKICIWACVRPWKETEQRQFHIYGTGEQMHIPEGDYIGTVQAAGGDLVWHIYDVTESY